MKPEISFNDLPQAVLELKEDNVRLEQKLDLALELLGKVLNPDHHQPMTVEQVAEYLHIPEKTVYAKLKKKELPGSKPCKHWVCYRDEIDKWVEASRCGDTPMTAAEENEAMRLSFRNGARQKDWMKEAETAISSDKKQKTTRVSRKVKKEIEAPESDRHEEVVSVDEAATVALEGSSDNGVTMSQDDVIEPAEASSSPIIEEQPTMQTTPVAFDGTAVPPTRETVLDYIEQNHLPPQVSNFYDYYEKRGWTASGTKIQNWISMLNRWASKYQQP